MSRRPLPTQLKVLRGTARPGRQNPNEPKPKVAAPRPPAHLSPAARKEWKRISPELEALGILSKIDLATLAGYCELFARWGRAEQEIQKSGEVITTPNGSLQVSPWVSIAHRSLSELRKFAAEYGLSPASRSKVTVTTPPQQENNRLAFLNGQQGKDSSRFFK